MKHYKYSSLTFAFVVLLIASAPSWSQVSTAPGASPATALRNCQALYDTGVRLSGTYWIAPSGSKPFTAWCDMETNGGGWTLLYNSTLGVEVAEFWHIPYVERLGRRGRPDLNALFYDGSLYQYGARYIDVIEDLRGKTLVVMEAGANGFDTASMRFIQPTLISGNQGIFRHQFAAGWSSADFDGDTYSGQCATRYSNISQHYGSCWYYLLGAGEADDTRPGPHLWSSIATSLGLFSDGTTATPVRRISRFVKW